METPNKCLQVVFLEKTTIGNRFTSSCKLLLKSVFLSNHYRSLHPQLITFSNFFFYNNRLKAFQDTNTNASPIEHHFINGGKFLERKNQEEAKKIASFIAKHIRNDEKLGIVAFSQTQLECIYDNLNDDIKDILNKRIENDSLFFQPLKKFKEMNVTGSSLVSAMDLMVMISSKCVLDL